jgi:hypothetical protein
MISDAEEAVLFATSTLAIAREPSFSKWRKIVFPGHEDAEYALFAGYNKSAEEMVVVWESTGHAEVWKKVDEFDPGEAEEMGAKGGVKDKEWLTTQILAQRAYKHDLAEKCHALEAIVEEFWEETNRPLHSYLGNLKDAIERYNKTHSDGYWGIEMEEGKG